MLRLNKQMTVIKEEPFYFTINEEFGTAIVGNITKNSPTAVDDCAEIENITVEIPSIITFNDKNYTVTSLHTNAFFNCQLQSITLPDTLKSIGLSAIDKTHIRDTINLPESLEYIGDWAISAACFTSIHIPSNVSYIGNGAIGCNPYLTNITVSENNPYFTIENGVLYDSSFTIIIQAITSIETITIPDSVRVIQAAAFSYSNLTELIIPASVKIINQQIIDTCNNLKRLYILGNPQFKLQSGKGIGSTYDKGNTLDLFYYQGSKIVTQDKDILLNIKVETIQVCRGYKSTTFGNQEVSKDIRKCQAISMPMTCDVSFTLRSYNFLFSAIALH